MGAASPPRTESGCAVVYNLVHSFGFEWIGTVWLGSIKITQTSFFVCISFGAEAFYLVSGLLVALSLMSGDLKLCQECVIVEF